MGGFLYFPERTMMKGLLFGLIMCLSICLCVWIRQTATDAGFGRRRRKLAVTGAGVSFRRSSKFGPGSGCVAAGWPAGYWQCHRCYCLVWAIRRYKTKNLATSARCSVPHGVWWCIVMNEKVVVIFLHLLSVVSFPAKWPLASSFIYKRSDC